MTNTRNLWERDLPHPQREMDRIDPAERSLRHSAQSALNAPTTHGQDPLQELREELDQIDRRIVILLARRLEHCDRIAEIKRRHGIPMMQPHRIEAVLRKTEALADQMGVNPSLVTETYRLIIAETCRREDHIISEAVAAPMP